MIAPDSGVQGFADYLARAGLKSTRQRERIVRAFFAAGRHTSAEELYRQIRARDSGIGLVTVYRTLKLLRQAGLATERAFGDGYARFDPTPADLTHHHLICTRCGMVQEFQDKELRALGTEGRAVSGLHHHGTQARTLRALPRLRARGARSPAAEPTDGSF